MHAHTVLTVGVVVHVRFIGDGPGTVRTLYWWHAYVVLVEGVVVYVRCFLMDKKQLKSY